MDELKDNLKYNFLKIQEDLARKIIFEVAEDEWIMEICMKEKKIRFNREKYPNFTEDDFAEKVIEILEGAVIGQQ